MASSKIVLFKGKKLSDGSRFVALRLTFDRKHKFVFIENVLESQWDAANKLVNRTHEHYKRINNTIKAKDSLAADLILQYESGKSDLTPEKIINILKDVKSSETFFDFFSDYVEEQFKKNQHHEATSVDGKGKNIWSFFYDKDFNVQFPNLERENEKSIFRKIVNQDIKFSSITPSFLRNLAIYLEVDGRHSERNIFNHMNVIRTVYNRAIEAKAITRENYPFSGKSGYKMRMPESQKIALEENEVVALEKAKLKERTDTWIHAKNSWILSLCWGGARISDVLKTKWEQINPDSLTYVMGKNNKPVEVPLVERAKRILKYYEKYKDENKGYIFPEMSKANLDDPKDVKIKLKNAIRIYNIWLKELAKEAKIKKSLNNHLARHTFGNLSGDKIPIQTLQLIYRHSDIQTTINYQRHWMNKQKVGEAVKTVMNF
ncbi:MAG: tyrosine-type recombinase/integrase [Bacteroidetes bacterium]|nr:tyrosine-type recombinase/integrase [Bacteroidota bacterium]